MDTFIVRIFRDAVPFDRELRGLVGRPGSEELPFQSVAQLMAILAAAVGQPGNEAGSTPSSSMREP